MRPRLVGFRCRILDNGLPLRESNLFIRVSYHTQTAFDKQDRALDTSLFY